jgi:signal transduction histidine kinase
VAIFSLICLYLSKKIWAINWPVALGAAPILSAAVAVEIMIERLGGYGHPYYAGLLQCILAIGVIFHWTVRKTALAVASLLLLWLGPALLRSEPLLLGPFVNNLFSLLVTAVIAVASNANRRASAIREYLVQKNLSDLNAALRHADRVKSQFFANVTHELRTPLTMILAPLETLLSEQPGALTAGQRSYLEANWKHAIRLMRLINDLLDLAKLGEGFLRLRLEKNDLRALLEEITAQSRPLAARKDLTLDLQIDGVPADLHIDVEMMERVLLNLIANGLKFTEQGGVKITLAAAGGEVRITVSDSGIGIPPEQLPTVFDRFVQGDATVTRKYGGTGLGLAFAKEIVELHGGRITVQSAPGQGSSFVVHLREGTGHIAPKAIDRRGDAQGVPDPRRAEDREPREWARDIQRRDEYRFAEVADVTDRRRVPRRPESKAAPRVLVVEDNRDVLGLISNQLGQEFTIYVAENGVQGLELARKHRPEVIISDVMMPEMDGLTMLGHLRGDPAIADTPVILLTARNTVHDRLEASAVGADLYLGKPFSPDELLASVKQLLGRRGRDVDRVLKAQMDSLESVSAGLAHEINNPLNFIKNSQVMLHEAVQKLQAALAEGGPGQAERIEKLRKRIESMVGVSQQGVARLENVVALVRRYARTGYSHEPEEIRVDEAVKDVVRLLTPNAEGFPAVVLDCKAGAATVRCVPEELNQIIRNLVDNAMQALPPEGCVQVRTRSEKGWVVLEVIDNGPGIPAASLEKVFAPFFTTKASNLGMGLCVVERALERAGGRIAVRSAPGVETVFTVHLPELIRASERRARKGDERASATPEA